MNDHETQIIDPDNLTDSRTVGIDTALPIADRIAQDIEEVKIPGLCRYGGITVEIAHDPQGPAFSEVLLSCLKCRISET